MTLKFRPYYGLCLLVLGAIGCFEGHLLPGARGGLALDGGADAAFVDGGVDAGDGDGGGDMPDAGPPPPTCSVALCDGESSLFGEMAACCTTQGQCGLDFSDFGLLECMERDAPGRLTSACPSADVVLFQLPGCCTPEGLCGLNVQELFPLGCITRGIPIPGFPSEAPQTCPAPPVD